MRNPVVNQLSGYLHWPFCVVAACFVLVCRLTAIAPAEEAQQADPRQVKSRWAVVADKSVRDRGISELLTVRLSKMRDVQLVEREELGKVLAELELNAARNNQRPTAIQIGRLAAAHGIIYLDEAATDGGRLLRARMLEARTGITLDTWIAPRTAADDEVDLLVGQMRQSIRTLRMPDRRYVGVIGIHNEESADVLDEMASTLTVLLERDLCKTPGIVLLDRDLLSRLQAKDPLTKAEQAVRGATTLIEGGIRRPLHAVDMDDSLPRWLHRRCL